MKSFRLQEYFREIFSHAEDCVELIEEKWKMASFVYHSPQRCDYWIKCVEKSQFLKFLPCFLVSNLLFCQIAGHTFQLKRLDILGENWCILGQLPPLPPTQILWAFVTFSAEWHLVIIKQRGMYQTSFGLLPLSDWCFLEERKSRILLHSRSSSDTFKTFGEV